MTFQFDEYMQSFQQHMATQEFALHMHFLHLWQHKKRKSAYDFTWEYLFCETSSTGTRDSCQTL